MPDHLRTNRLIFTGATAGYIVIGVVAVILLIMLAGCATADPFSQGGGYRGF